MSYRFVHDDREYLLAAGDRLETDLGVLEVPDAVAPGDTVETHLGEAFGVRELRLPDCFEHFERTGAPMMPRDVGLVLGSTGASQGDRALDAGTGTGVLAAGLGLVGATVDTYEVDPDHAAVARENVAVAGLEDRITVHEGDIREELDELTDGDPYDVVTLDTADAPAIVPEGPDLLVPGGFLVVYSPFVEDARDVVQAAREAGLADVRARETIQRDLDVDDRGTRPATRGVGHTGYLTLARRP